MAKLPITLTCGLLIAIFFVAIQSPHKESATAQQQIAEIDQSVKDLEANPDKLTLEVLNSMNTALERVATILEQHGNELRSIEACQAEESNEFRGKFVSLEAKLAEKPAQSPLECECECNCKAELDSLKARVAALEAKAPPFVSYFPAVSSASSQISYGSTGSAVQGYGSTGSALQSRQNFRSIPTANAPTYAPPLPTAPIVNSECYVDEWGRTRCLQRQATSVMEARPREARPKVLPNFLPNLRTR